MAVGPGRPRLQGEKRAEAAPLGAWVCEIDVIFNQLCSASASPLGSFSITVTAPVLVVHRSRQ